MSFLQPWAFLLLGLFVPLLLGSTAIDQPGYSRTTPFVATLGAGLDSFVPNRPGTGSWENPFPSGFVPDP